MTVRPPSGISISFLTMVLLAAPGCASSQNALLRTEVQDLQNRIYELQKRNAESQVRIQELTEGAATPPSGAVRPGEGAAPVPTAGPAKAVPDPEVPGSTVDLGDGGPSRNVEKGSQAPAKSPAGQPPAGEAAGAILPEAAPATGSEEADKLYVQGYSQFNSGDYPAAAQTFQDFLARAPESDLADDAQYWIGECFFSRKDYRRAILEFRKVIDQYPFGNRVPHAFLKLGLSYLALGDRDRAAENLETVVQAFPKSDVATVARATLDQIGKP